MNDLDERLRRALGQIADDAPTGDDLFAIVERRVATHRRRTAAAMGGFALAAAIIAAVVTIAGLRDAPAHRRVAVQTPATSASVDTVAPTTVHADATTTPTNGPAATAPRAPVTIAPPALGGVVSPAIARPGETITIVGTVPEPGCPRRGVTILQSDFAWSHHEVPDYVATPYDNAGHFTITATLPTTITAGRHGFLIRCAATNQPLAPAAGGEIGGPNAFTFFIVAGP